LHSTFTANDAYNLLTDACKKTMAKKWIAEYNATPLSKKIPVKPIDPTIPYAYILKKNKDLKKNRPLVSYFNHPLKKPLNMTARALSYMLKQSGCDQNVLWKTIDLKHKVRQFNKMKDAGDRISTLTGDLANMYTSLDHDSIKTALTWIISKTKLVTRRHAVSVPITKHFGEPSFANGTMNPDTHKILTFNDISNMVLFDLDNTCFSISETILQQHTGISMGSPLSPALAIIVCAYYEEQLWKSQIANPAAKKTMMVRYMDDTFMMTAHNNTRAQKRQVNLLQRAMKTAYHEKMTMEVEPLETGYKFLESEIHVHDSITLKFFDKNATHLKEHNEQKFYQYQHFSSFSPRRQKQATVTSTLYRIDRFTTTKEHLHESIATTVHQFLHLQYPLRMLIQCIQRMSVNAQSQDHWSLYTPTVIRKMVHEYPIMTGLP
jgi:hypothetical protein